jgi:membrane-associated phospholipid phosphatase
VQRATAHPVRPLGLPVDRLLGGYAIVSGAALLFPFRPAVWPLLLAVHAVAALLAFGWTPLARAWNALARRMPGSAVFVGDVYPLVLIPFLYAELASLNFAVWNGLYFDDLIIAVEQTIFRGQPSREWAIALPSLLLSEVLHAAYLSYYFVIFVPPLIIARVAGRSAFRDAVFTLMLTFVAHYMFFIWFPVQGPRYLFPPPAGPIAEGMVYRFTHVVLEAGSSQGAAFPSSHVGVAVAQVLVTWRYSPRLAPAVALMALGLALGAIYGGFHYATDVMAGALLGAACAITAPVVRRALRPDAETERLTGHAATPA